MEGTIKFFNTEKGFGFIQPNEGDKDIFVHINNIDRDIELNEGDKVTFETEETSRGPSAINVKK